MRRANNNHTSGLGLSVFATERVVVRVRASYFSDRWQHAPISAAREADP